MKNEKKNEFLKFVCLHESRESRLQKPKHTIQVLYDFEYDF